MTNCKTRMKFLCICMSVIFLLTWVSGSAVAATPENGSDGTDTSGASFSLACKSAVLMEASTGRVLYEQNPHESLPPASVTKIMTLLLVMEAIDEGKLKMEDIVTASAHAASMGGSQIYLKEGEQMSARDMIKSVVISSANDAAVALAEHIAGSEAVFVQMMNEKAAALGMKNTHFENTNGLDDTAQNHVTSAADIAIMSQALIRHEEILSFSSVWMDTIRDGSFGLTNTNRLVRFYKGCNGLKTGSTQKAGFCISVTAEREGMTLICVIMGAESRDIRNQAATQLLDWGFANYGLYVAEEETFEDIRVTGGEIMKISVSAPRFSCVLPKNSIASVEKALHLPEKVTAPVRAGEAIGEIVYIADGKEVGRIAVSALQTSERIGFWGVFGRILGKYLLI